MPLKNQATPIKSLPLLGLFKSIMAILLLSYCLALIYIWHLNKSEIKSDLQHINSILSQGVRTTLKGHELILRGIGRELIELDALQNPENGRALIERLKHIDPGMVGFGLARTDGQLILVSGIAAGKPLPNLLQREASSKSFSEVLTGSTLKTGRPYFFEALGNWVLPIRTPLFDEQGRMIAVMTAGYSLENASAAWSNNELPQNIQIALVDHDGYILFAQPPINKTAVENTGKINFRKITDENIALLGKLKQQKSFLALNTPFGQESHQFLSYSYIDEYDLHAGAMIGRNAVIQSWFERIFFPSTLLLIFIVGGSWAYLRASRQQMQSAEQYRTLFEAASDATFLMDGQVFRDCNRATLKIFDCTREQIIGASPLDFSPEQQPDGQLSSEKGKEKIRAALEGDAQFFEWRHNKADGTPFDAEVSLNAVHIGDKIQILASVRDVTERKKFAEDMAYQACHDGLTGLPNRKAMHERFEDFIEQSQLKGESIFLVLFDLDRFKEINDTLGHHFGDQVLHSLASRIQSIFDDSNAEVFRLGGDEFAVLFSTTHSIDELLELVRSHVQQLRNTLFIESISLSIGASVGIAAYPEHGNDSHELLRTADVAMYHAKRLGLGVSIYNKQFDSHSTEQLSLASELNNAVQLHQLVLHYQPKIDIRSGKTIGFEALVRWRHPSRGLLFPDKFIGLVEMSELIHSFTREIISLAVSDKKILHEKGYLQPVAINLSPRNLFNESCLQDLLLLLDQHDLKSNEIEIELTESAVMDDPDHAISLLQRFQDKNIHIAIDDFGTGYSSLAYLRRLPVSALKIDRSFVMDMVNDSQDRAIVKSTIALAHSIELNVIAEGVENDEILDLLGKMGCDTAQGYGISKPLPLEQLLEWLEDSGTIRPGLFT